MGKTILKYFLGLVLFPLTILFLILKFVSKNISKVFLSRYLSSVQIHELDCICGEEFEDFVYILFTSLGFSVKKTKKSHDYGADLIIKIKDIKIILQCKLYTSHNVSLNAVQEVYSAVKFYNGSIGIVLSNTYFTKSAINLATSTNVLLWDRTMLEKLLKLNKQEKIKFKKELSYKLENFIKNTI